MSRPLSPVGSRPSSERQVKMLGYPSPTYNIELRSPPSTTARIRELESQLDLLRRQNQLKDDAIRNIMLEHEENLDDSDRNWADRCAALGAKLRAERAEYDAHTAQHREFLTDMATILDIKSLNPTMIKDTVLGLHLKYLELEQHMQQEEQDKFLYRQQADDRVAEAQQTAAAAVTRALAADAAAAAANKRAAIAETQVNASGRSVASAQTVADVEVSLAKTRANAAEAKAAEVVQQALEDKIASQHKAQAAEAEASAAAAAHKQAAAALTAALLEVQQLAEQAHVSKASVSDIMQSNLFAHIKSLLSERDAASPVQGQRKSDSPVLPPQPALSPRPVAGLSSKAANDVESVLQRVSRTSGRGL